MSAITRVLIVDDKEENLYYLRALFTGHGMEVDEARHGAEALVKARMQQPSIIVSDLLMPVMDGYTLLRYWKADPLLKKIPFIVYTATYTEAEDEKLALDLGADAFILKPAEPEDFLLRIREILAGATLTEPTAPKGVPIDEQELLKIYSETLIRKLEEKMLLLEQANQALEQDIAERKKVAEALRRSEQEQRQLAGQLEAERSRLEEAQRVAKVGSWETDLENFSVNWSEETHRIFETDPKNFIPSHERFLSFVHPEDREAVNNAFKLSMGRSEANFHEHRILLADGREKHLEERWQIYRDTEGRPVRALGICHDITEKRRAELEIRRSNELLKAVSDGSPDAIYIKDLEGKYLLFNEAAARFVGRKVEEVLGKDDYSIFGPESADLVREIDQRVIASNHASTSEEVLTAAGITRTYHATKAPYRDGDGRIIGLIGISRDVTERKLTEAKIHEQAALLDKARDAIIVRDLEHRILYWNKGAESLYGWKAEEVMGRSAENILYKDRDAYHAATETTLKLGEWTGELDQINKAKETRTVDGRWTLVRDEQGNPKSILTINTDITQSKRLEQQFLRAQRMESIGTLAGGIAHDLNNVLAPIMMAVELLKLDEQDPARIQTLDMIENSARRGASMVSQVLTFARGLEGRRVEVQMRHLLQEMVKITTGSFPKNITIRNQMAGDLWTLKADPTQLHQVLLNLCVNARDAMPDGGSIKITAENVMLDEQFAAENIDASAGPYVHIEVADSGSGIPQKVIDKIFDPFFTTKEIGKGTGLGLSTVMAIIKSHGGFIRVQSEPGMGAAFHIYLPAQTTVSSAASQEGAAEPPKGKGETVLIVDDEDSIRQIAKRTLETFGYKVLLAGDGNEAIALYTTRQQDIAVIITDMMMPVMDGQATIQALLQMNPKVRIIGTTGMMTSSKVSQITSLGIQYLLPKPFTAETLLNTVRKVIDAQ